MTDAFDRPLLIAGGGIGGLSAAIALSRRGFAVHVLEAEAEFSESGAGIQIGPNGSRILRAWGLGEALDRLAAKPEAIVIGDGLSGRTLATVPLGREAESRYGAPYYVAERRLLHRLLLEEVGKSSNVRMSTGFRVTGLRDNGARVVALSEDGREAEGRAVIGADGVHSKLRSRVTGETPFFSGRNAWRATAATNVLGRETANSVQLWLGPDAHLVHYCCGCDGPLNAVAVVTGEAASPGWGTAGDPGRLAAFFADWAEEPRRILAQFEGWMTWPLLALPPLEHWTDDTVALIGDAAHPLMPFLASGAVMAIEDAAVLAAETARSPGAPPSAFRAYETRRMPRVRRVQRASERMGEIYHMDGAMRLARNLTLAAVPAPLLFSRNDWLYGYRAEDQDRG